MMRFQMRGVWVIGALVASATATSAVGSIDAFDPPIPVRIADRVESGPVTTRAATRGVVFEAEVSVPGVRWIRLIFEDAELGAAPPAGRETELRITSDRDGAVQRMTAEHLRQWRDTSAYFNGDRVRVEIVADPGAAPSRLTIESAYAGPSAPAAASICGPDDDRVPSTDARIGRVEPNGCTSWLIDDANGCLLTAGHCTPGGFAVIEFNVPLSSFDGSRNHPGPEDQYAIDPVSLQSNGGGAPGDDWAYFGCFRNTNTDLTPYEAQGLSFVLADEPPAVEDQSITITGYGVTSPPVPSEWNRAQKTHTGPYVAFFGTVLQYATDTTGGNSGSPVIDRDTGRAIGIHTHGGCSGGANNGTAISHPDLQDALANPRGVCKPAPACPGDVDEDGSAGFSDLLEILSSWGPCGAPCPQDVDGSGDVGFGDVLLVLSVWGDCG